MKTRDVFAVFNRGRISRLALGRTDVSRVALSAEVQTNWMPRVLGPMSLRPGLQYHGTEPGNGAYIPFIYDTDDTAILELTAGKMRVWENGDTLVTRETVSATISNGGFYDDLSGWTTDDEGSAVSDWLAITGAGGNGVLRLTGTGYDYAKTRQGISVLPAEADVQHTLAIRVSRGPVILRIGSAVGTDDVFRQAVLRTGSHSISFVPGGDFWIEFKSSLQYPVWVGDVAFETGGPMEVTSPWDTVELCRAVRTTQSGDVVYCACGGVRQRRIERRPNNSWSIVNYETSSGPYLSENTSTVRITPDGLTGFISLTASEAIFREEHVGSLFRLTSQGQNVEATLSGDGQYSNPIRVSGAGSSRTFSYGISGTWAGTWSIQRSIGEVGAWVTIYGTSSNQALGEYYDELDNVIAYYRLGFETGNYTSGSADMVLNYANGSISGNVRVTNYTSPTVVSGVVLDALGGTDATEVWAEGAWSDLNGWPQATAIGDDGRLWWSGQGRNWGSVPDAFDSFDPDIEGDAAPINRGVGTGTSNTTNWMLPLSHLIAGTAAAEYSIRSTSFDEPITPSNYNAKAPTTKGSAPVPAVVVDDRGYFVGRNTESLYELKFEPQSYRYKAIDTTLLCPEIADGGFVRIAVQVEPDIRVHCVRADGTVAVLVADEVENVLCWIDLETDGLVKDVVVLPGEIEDRVFYRVRRTINGVNVFYHEELARFEQCVGGTINRQADSFIIGNGPVSGLSHLNGKSVVIWGDGQDRGAGTVASGSVAGHSYANWCAGLPYTATYKSAKLSGQTSLGLSLAQYKRINSIGLILDRTHHDGLEFGPDFDTMDRLPSVEDGAVVADGTIYGHFDQEPIGFPGLWDPNSRICLRATAPRPCTVLAAILNVDRQDSD